MSQPTSSHNKNSAEEIHQLLHNFSKEEVIILCYEHFKSVYKSFEAEMGRSEKHLLVKHCEKNQEVDKLKRLISSETVDLFHIGGPVPPEKFFGHERALNLCRTKLADNIPANIAIVGERRIGKTSLLHYIDAYGSASEWGQHICLFLDCAVFGGSITFKSFWEEFLHLLRDRIDQTSLFMELILELAYKPDLDTPDIRGLLRHYQRAYPQQSIVLLIDEFELFFQNYNSEIGQILTSLKSMANYPTFFLITASRKPLVQICRPFRQDTGLDFHNIFVHNELATFTKKETEACLQFLLSPTSVNFTPEEATQVWQISQWKGQGALPIFVQIAASIIFEIKRNSDEVDYKMLREKFEQQASFYRDEILEDDEYEQGLRVLEEQIPLNDSTLILDFYRLSKELRNTLKAEFTSGTTPILRHTRNAIIKELTEISRQVTNLTFDQLASGQQPG